MKDRGYITVFLSLLLTLLLLLFTAVFTLTSYRNAESRGAVAMRSAMSSVRAEYHRDIFDHYHVLLLDANLDGEGLGKLETLAEERMQEDLGEDFSVGEMMLTGYTRMVDNDLAAFKEQVEKVVPYLAADKGIDRIKEEVRGKDRPLSESAFAEADAAAQSSGVDGDKDLKAGKAGTEGSKDGKKKYKDPRMTIGLMGKAGIAYSIAPADIELSTEVLKKAELPSTRYTGILKMDINTSFSSYSQLKRDTTQIGSWLGSLEAGSAGLLYAGSCFNCLTEKVREDTVLCMEMEYLIAGEMTDMENYKKTVDRLMVLRTAINLAYILTDSEKMAICEAAAAAACVLFPPATPVVKILMAGAWSYIEAISDAKRLVNGKRVPFVKTRDDWLTDFDGAGRANQVYGSDDEGKGLNYKEYLYILMAMNMDGAWYRMLDLMQVNANSRLEEGEHPLNMLDAITAFGMTVDVEYDGKTFTLDEEIGY